MTKMLAGTLPGSRHCICSCTRSSWWLVYTVQPWPDCGMKLLPVQGLLWPDASFFEGHSAGSW